MLAGGRQPGWSRRGSENPGVRWTELVYMKTLTTRMRRREKDRRMCRPTIPTQRACPLLGTSKALRNFSLVDPERNTAISMHKVCRRPPVMMKSLDLTDTHRRKSLSFRCPLILRTSLNRRRTFDSLLTVCLLAGWNPSPRPLGRLPPPHLAPLHDQAAKDEVVPTYQISR